MNGPMQISFDITNRCNYRCLHCFNESGSENLTTEMSSKDIGDFINDVLDIKPFSFCFCGGEPLLRAELLVSISKILSDNGIKPSMVTNGFYMDDSIAKQLKSNKINNVQISLDGNEESHIRLRGNKAAYQKAINALELLKQNGIHTGIAFSPTSWNIDDFEHVYDIAQYYQVDQLRVQRLMPIGRASQTDTILPDDIQYRRLRKKIYKAFILYSLGKSKVEIEWGDPISHIIQYLDTPKVSDYGISIKANGDIAPSIYVPYVAGNVKTKKLSEYWTEGLKDIWHDDKFRRAADHFTSVSTMSQ